MAATLQSTDVAELEKQRIGYIGVSLTEWTTNDEPQYTAGSSFECAGSVYYCTALEDCGTNAEWAAIANSTLVYSYFNTSTLVFYWSSSPPAWDTAKHGYYHTVSTTHRCLCQSYKNASGLYSQKSILNDRDFKRRYYTHGIISASATEDYIFGELESYVPNVGDLLFIQGMTKRGTTAAITFVSHGIRFSTGIIRLYGLSVVGVLNSMDMRDGTTIDIDCSIAWLE